MNDKIFFVLFPNILYITKGHTKQKPRKKNTEDVMYGTGFAVEPKLQNSIGLEPITFVVRISPIKRAKQREEKTKVSVFVNDGFKSSLSVNFLFNADLSASFLSSGRAQKNIVIKVKTAFFHVFVSGCFAQKKIERKVRQKAIKPKSIAPGFFVFKTTFFARLKRLFKIQ